MTRDREILKNDHPGNINNRGIGIDPLVVLNLIRKNWYFLLIGLIAGYFGARRYIAHTLPVYRVSTTILITENGERSGTDRDAILLGMGLQGGMANIDNQIRMLYSRALTESALEGLNFEVDYYRRTLRNILPFYPDVPVRVISENDIPLPKNIEFSITFLGDDWFILESGSESYPLNIQAVFGQDLEINGKSIRIAAIDENWVNSNVDEKIFFVIHSRESLIRRFNSRINAQLLSGSILEVSITGTNRAKDVEFLNRLAEVFQSVSLDKKNQEAIRRIQFIDNQLVGISDSLLRTETMLQQFRSRHRIMDISAQGQALLSQINTMEREISRLSLEAEYYDYLEDYLVSDVEGSAPMIPITMGISDPALTRLVSELAEMHGQLSDRRAGEMNPLQNLLVQRMRNTKDALLETLKGLRQANNMAMADAQKQVARINTQASVLPETERQLLGFERQFRLNDELYTFLLQMRSQQQMQMASNIADSHVVDPADIYYSSIVYPNRTMVMFVGVFAGTGIPMLFIFILFLFNKKLKHEEISAMTDLPVVGNIPVNTGDTKTIVLDKPASNIAEAFRMLRSNMLFFTKDSISPVFLITSSMPEEGKSFTAMNLASAYSMLGKKTVIVDFDLRKSTMARDFNIPNHKGVSTWLIGQDNIEDIIQQTPHENLSIIPSGPFPPNPSELIASEKTAELFKKLKNCYEYIIIDSAPIGIVSDTLHLVPLADTCLMVVRPGQTLRDLFGTTLSQIDGLGIKGLCMVINGIKSEHTYGRYSKKYGYTDDEQKTKRFWLMEGAQKEPGINQVRKGSTTGKLSRKFHLKS